MLPFESWSKIINWLKIKVEVTPSKEEIKVFFAVFSDIRAFFSISLTLKSRGYILVNSFLKVATINKGIGDIKKNSHVPKIPFNNKVISNRFVPSIGKIKWKMAKRNSKIPNNKIKAKKITDISSAIL